MVALGGHGHSQLVDTPQRDSVSNARKLEAITGHFSPNVRRVNNYANCPLLSDSAGTCLDKLVRIVHRTPAELAEWPFGQ